MTTWIERYEPGKGDGPKVAVKDLIDVAGSVTTAGCRALADSAPAAEEDAACIVSVRAAGGRLAGKTNLHELAFGTSGVNGWFGTPENPADPGRVPGGSSSGSAAAVATGEADVGIGSDTGGSVRIPAACCGVFGLKTTHGSIPMDGVWPLAPSYDTLGPLAATAANLSVGLGMLGWQGTDGFNGITPASLGLVELPAQSAAHVDPLIDAAVRNALRETGFALAAAPLPRWHEAWLAHQKLLCGEAWACDRQLLDGALAGGVSDEVTNRLRLGASYSPAELAAAQSVGAAWQLDMTAALDHFGVLALPTLPIRPPTPADVKPGFNLLTSPVNLAGLPAVSIPIPIAGRPPTGLQLVGPAGSELVLCALAVLIESATSGFPPISLGRQLTSAEVADAALSGS